MEQNQDQSPEQMEQEGPEQIAIILELEGDKIKCQVIGDHVKLASMFASVLVDNRSPLRDIVNDALLAVLTYESKDKSEEVLSSIITPIKGEA